MRESLVERKVAGSIPREDVAFSVFNLAIMLRLFCACCAIIIVKSGILLDWYLFWSFHFRNIGLAQKVLL